METMFAMSYSFGTKLFECLDKSPYPNDLSSDILNYWKEGYRLQHMSTGCLFVCALVTLELMRLYNCVIMTTKLQRIIEDGED
ncbi:unnamed protein product [Leptidea sinapis]|uniref:Uncharacterized protein n=1 Tax=Leptidea sinapis TaxID=189913 RepID=A0A5E4QI14_9NEOP|nr:unnamed protein product [Leptidea sinapis]